MSQQSLRQASIRASTGTAHDYNGDWHALFDAAGIAAGPYNQRLLSWINTTLGTSYTEINGAMAALAAANSAGTFSSIGTLNLSTAPTLTNGAAYEGVDDVFADVTTDQGSGTLYYLVDQNATRTAAQVKASGASQAVSSSGIQNTGFATGLAASTAYYIHLMHETAAGMSNVIDIAFTTNAALSYNASADAIEVYDGTFGSYSGSYTPGTGVQGVVVEIQLNNVAPVDAPAVTLGGVAMTFLGHSYASRTNSANTPSMSSCFVYFLATTATGSQTIGITAAGIETTRNIQVVALTLTGGIPRSWRNYAVMTPVQPETNAAFDAPFYNNPVSIEAEDVLIGVHAGLAANSTDILRFGTSTPATASVLSATWNSTSNTGLTTALNPASDASGTLNYRCAAGFGTVKGALASAMSPRRVKGVGFNEFAPYYVFPRTSGKNARDLVISGPVFGGGTPSSVEARVVCQDGTAVTSWAALTNATYSSSTYSGTIADIPMNDFSAISTADRSKARYDKMYLVEVRRADYPSRVHRSTSPFMVGLFFIVHGQSNARQSFSGAKGITANHIITPGYVTHFADENGATVTNVWRLLQAVTFARVAAETIIRNLGYPVMAACVAQDATNIQWLSGASNTPMLSAVAVAQKVGYVDGVIWHQGEGNSTTGASLSVASYAAALSSILSQIKAATGQSENLKLFLSSLATSTSASYIDAQWNQTLRCHYECNSQDSNLFFCSSNFDAGLTDGTHYDNTASDKMGERMGYQIAKQFGASSLVIPRFHIASASITSATTTTVNFTHYKGTDFTIDGSGTTANAAPSFEVSADGTTWTAATDYTKNSASQIVLTHSSLGVVTRFVRYMYGRNPTKTYLLRDNWTHPITAAVGVPLEPTGANITCT